MADCFEAWGEELQPIFSSSSFSLTHCHIGVTDCEGVEIGDRYTFSGTFTITNQSDCILTLNPDCTEESTWLEVLLSGVQTPDTGGEVLPCARLDTVLTDAVGNLIDPSIPLEIAGASEATFNFKFFICDCCEEDLINKLFNCAVFAKDFRFHFSLERECLPEGADLCCHHDVETRTQICIGDNEVYEESVGFYEADAVTLLPGIVTFDGSGASVGDTINQKIVIKNNLVCGLDDLCANLYNEDGTVYAGASVSFNVETTGPICPAVISMGSGAFILYSIDWTIPDPTEPAGPLFLKWNYCDICPDCCDEEGNPVCEEADFSKHLVFLPPTLCEDCPDAATVEPTIISCHGECDGKATVTIGDGCALPYSSVTWTPALLPADQIDDPAAGTTIGNNLCGGVTYLVEFEDADGCASAVEFELEEPELLECTVEITNETCPGADDGEALCDVSGGTGPYEYLWDDTAASTTALITGLAPGVYTVQVTDAEGCITECTGTVLAATTVNGNYAITNKTCPNSSDGAIATPGVTGGTGPYTFLWTYPDGITTATSQDLAGLDQTGNYNVQITDFNGCVVVETYVLGVDNTYTITETITDINCSGANTGEIAIVVAGTAGPFTYAWVSTDPGFVDPGTATIPNLEAGDYTVTITDTITGCVITGGPYTVSSNSLIKGTVLYATNIDCRDVPGEACVGYNVTGGVGPYTYAWEYFDGAVWQPLPASINANNICLEVGDIPINCMQIRVVITDSLGCVNQSDPAEIGYAEAIQIICNPTPQSAPGLSDGSAQFVVVNAGDIPCDPRTGTLALSTGDTFNGMSSGDIAEVTNKFCQVISWTFTNDRGCQLSGDCEITCPPDPGVEGCCDDPLALNYNCDGCEDPDPDACRYDHITCPADWVKIDGNPLSECISEGTVLEFKASPHFPIRVTCDPVDSCCDEYGSVPEWDGSATYAAGDLIWFGDQGDMWRSLQDDNIGNKPDIAPNQGVWWEKCCECGDAPEVRDCYRFAEITVTDAAGTVVTITFTDMPTDDPNFDSGWKHVDWTMCQDLLADITEYPIDYLFDTGGLVLAQGELTIGLKLWDCYEEVECCEQKVILCKDIRTSQISCHNWEVLDLSPAIGYTALYPVADWTEVNKYTLRNYENTYSETKYVEVGSPAEFALPQDDVYIVKVERMYQNKLDATITVDLWLEPKTVIIYEFCVLLKCLKAVILDIFCNGNDCCNNDCNEEDKLKEDSKRWMANKMTALWASFMAIVQKDKLKYLDLYYIDSERDMSISKIANIMKMLKEMSSKCKPCVDGNQIELDNFSGYPTEPSTDPPTPNDPDIVNPNCCD